MRILFLHQYFYPDISANSQYLTDLTKDLSERGHHVTVIASRAVQHGQKGLAASFERIGSVDVFRTPATNLGKRSVATRIVDYSSFLATSALRSIAIQSHDVVVTVTTPPLLPALGPTIRAIRGSRFVYLTEDVYPEMAIRMGKLREGSLLERGVRAAIDWSLRRADRVIVIGRCMRERIIARGVESRCISLIPNWADPDEIYPLAENENPMTSEVGLEGKFALVYSGNMGWGHDFGTFLGAAESLGGDVRLVFIGDGYRRLEIETALKERKLKNVQLLPYQPRSRLIQSLNLGAVALVSQRREVDGLIVPSKLYALMSAARPILFVGSETSEVGRTILETGCGMVVAEGDVSGLVDAISQLRGDEDLCHEMGQKGRKALLERYQRRLAVDAYEKLLLDVVQEKRAA